MPKEDRNVTGGYESLCASSFKENIQSVPELNAMLQNYRQKITDQISDLRRILRFIDDKLIHNQSLLKPDRATSEES